MAASGWGSQLICGEDAHILGLYLPAVTLPHPSYAICSSGLVVPFAALVQSKDSP